MVNTKSIPLFSLPSLPSQTELDASLHKLIQEVIAHPPDSPERIKKVESLMVLASYLPGILTQQRLDKGYQPFYEDALKLTARDITKN